MKWLWTCLVNKDVSRSRLFDSAFRLADAAWLWDTRMANELFSLTESIILVQFVASQCLRAGFCPFFIQCTVCPTPKRLVSNKLSWIGFAIPDASKTHEGASWRLESYIIQLLSQLYVWVKVMEQFYLIWGYTIWKSAKKKNRIWSSMQKSWISLIMLMILAGKCDIDIPLKGLWLIASLPRDHNNSDFTCNVMRGYMNGSRHVQLAYTS